MRRWLLSIVLVIGWLLLLVQPAMAHANLVRSSPAIGELLATAPTQIELEFSEELDPSFSRVQLYNSQNQVVNAGPGVVDTSAPQILRLALEPLPRGSYTAIWRSRSAADGHVTEGSVPFGVGVAASATSLIPAVGSPDPATERLPWLDATLRWLNLLIAAVAFGGLAFGVLVWRPAWQSAQPSVAPPVSADVTMTQALRRLLIGGSVVFILSNALFLISQAATAADVPLLQALGTPALELLGSHTGQLIVARVLLLLLIIGVAWRLPVAATGAQWPWYVALGLGAAVLLTFSLGAHGAAEAQGAALAVALDWLHLLAMVAWLGGLLPLLIALRAARRMPEQSLPLAWLVPRFSRVAVLCVVLLTATGIYSYFLHISRLDLLAATTYGRALLVKLVLFGVLLLLGALNLLVFSRHLRRSGQQLARKFIGSVRVELLAGALLLFAVGAMTSVAPSLAAWQAHERLGLAQQATVDAVDLTLRVAPAQIGDNEWAVDVVDRRAGAVDAPAKVLLRFDMQGMVMGQLQAETQSNDAQRYTTRGSFTSMGGRWNIEVILRRAGFDDVTHTFQMDIVRSGAQAQ